MIVKIEYVTKIPSEAVTYSVLGYGGTFNGGIKSTLIVEIDLTKSGSDSLSVKTRTWGESREYSDNDAQEVSGKPDWYRKLVDGAAVLNASTLPVNDSNLKASWETPDGATHGVKLFVAGENPLLSLAPAIDGEIIVGLKDSGGSVQYTLTGDQDGFPDHTISINGKAVHHHDCVGAGKTPGNLAPPSEVDVSKNWTNL